MAFQTPLTINEVITNIHSKKYLLLQFKENLYGVQTNYKAI
jgi:hypothetical protein